MTYQQGFLLFHRWITRYIPDDGSADWPHKARYFLECWAAINQLNGEQ